MVLFARPCDECDGIVVARVVHGLICPNSTTERYLPRTDNEPDGSVLDRSVRLVAGLCIGYAYAASACRLMSRPSLSTSSLTRRPIVTSITLAMMKLATKE